MQERRESADRLKPAQKPGHPIPANAYISRLADDRPIRDNGPATFRPQGVFDVLTPDQWRESNELFFACLEVDPESRASFVEEMAAHDPQIEREVLALLAAHDESSTFLSHPALSPNSLRELRPEPLAPGKQLGKYVIQRTLGSGGFAHVYLASESLGTRDVALKVSRSLGSEARRMAPLRHPHIVRIYAQSEFQEYGLLALAMQYVPGATLQDLIDHLNPSSPGTQIFKQLDSVCDEKITFDRDRARLRENWSGANIGGYLRDVLSRVAEAMDHAHKQGILHLDLKPSNILIDPYGVPYLTDFNISQSTEEDIDPSTVGGTPLYMSPEQSKWFETDETVVRPELTTKSDVFSWGKLWELVLNKYIPRANLKPAAYLLTTRCLRVEPGERPEMLTVTREAKEIADAEQILARWPAGNRLTQLMSHFPVTTLVLLLIVPQLIGSFLNITYNMYKIGPEMTDAQQNVFRDAILPYNLIMYPICVGLILPWVFRFHKWTHHPGQALPEKFFGLIPWTIAVTSLGWLPGAVFFPYVVSGSWEAIPILWVIHFGMSFVFSWVIATTYSTMFLDWFICEILLPNYSAPPILPSPSVRLRLRQRNTVMRLTAGLIPLIAAILIITQSPIDMADYENYLVFQLSVIVLLIIGLFGFLLALKLTQRGDVLVNQSD